MLALWSLVTLKEKVYVGILLACCVGAFWFARHERNVGRDEVLASILAKRAVVESVTVVRTDSIAVAGKTKFVKLAAAHDTIRDSVLVHLTDTVIVKEFIDQTTATIRACSEALSASLTACQARDTLIATLRQQLALKLPPASGGASWKERVMWGLVGAGVGYVAHR